LSRRHDEDNYAGAISFGAFLILAALFYIVNSSLLSEANAFVHDFKLIQVYQSFWLFESSTNHPILYTAAAQFSYIFAFVHVVVLALLFAGRSSTRAKARTFSSIIFWLGAGYVLGILATGTLGWVSFLGALVVLIGISMVVRSTILLFASRRRTLPV
jgi:hypothetical protein